MSLAKGWDEHCVSLLDNRWCGKRDPERDVPSRDRSDRDTRCCQRHLGQLCKPSHGSEVHGAAFRESQR